MCMLKCLNMPSIPYCSMHMTIGWNGLRMPTEGCSMHMPIIVTNFKVRGVSYVMKVIITHIPIEWGLLTLMYIDSLEPINNAASHFSLRPDEVQQLFG